MTKHKYVPSGGLASLASRLREEAKAREAATRNGSPRIDESLTFDIASAADGLIMLSERSANAERDAHKMRELLNAARQFVEGELAQRGDQDAQYPAHRRARPLLTRILQAAGASQ